MTSCMDPHQIQRLNQQAEVLFVKEHLFEPNFVAPMPYPETYADPDEEELLGVEYAMCQSTHLSSREYYISKGMFLTIVILSPLIIIIYINKHTMS